MSFVVYRTESNVRYFLIKEESKCWSRNENWKCVLLESRCQPDSLRSFILCILFYSRVLDGFSRSQYSCTIILSDKMREMRRNQTVCVQINEGKINKIPRWKSIINREYFRKKTGKLKLCYATAERTASALQWGKENRQEPMREARDSTRARLAIRMCA